MNIEFINFVNQFSSFFCIVPLLIGILKYRDGQLNPMMFPLLILQMLSLITEILNVTLSYKGLNNMIIINIYTLFEFTLITLFYKKFFDQFFPSKLHYLFIGAFSILVLVNVYLLNKKNNIDYISSSFECIVFIVYPLLALLLVMKSLLYDNLLQSSFFWINNAILFYFSGNLFLFVFSGYLEKNDQSTYLNLFLIHTFFNVLNYSLISIGFWKAKKQ